MEFAEHCQSRAMTPARSGQLDGSTVSALPPGERTARSLPMIRYGGMEQSIRKTTIPNMAHDANTSIRHAPLHYPETPGIFPAHHVSMKTGMGTITDILFVPTLQGSDDLIEIFDASDTLSASVHDLTGDRDYPLATIFTEITAQTGTNLFSDGEGVHRQDVHGDATDSLDCSTGILTEYYIPQRSTGAYPFSSIGGESLDHSWAAREADSGQIANVRAITMAM